MTEPLIIRRGAYTLTVSQVEGRLSLSGTGGDGITEDEFASISEFAKGHPDAERFLGKIRAKMGERG
jgi:hypothetical protein